MSNRIPKAGSARTGWVRKAALAIVSIILILLIAGLLLVMGAEAPTSRACNPGESLRTEIITSEQASVRVEVAATGAEKTQGLSGRNCLDPDSGMLFAYDNPGDYCFWMKDMKFAIDMVWLDDDKKIVTIKDKVAPDTYPESFCPDRPAQHIVEVDAGKAARYGWRVGTELGF